MAAVLALIMLPIIAACGFIFGVVDAEASASSICAGVVFFSLAGFLLISALRFVHEAEGPEPHH